MLKMSKNKELTLVWVKGQLLDITPDEQLVHPDHLEALELPRTLTEDVGGFNFD